MAGVKDIDKGWNQIMRDFGVLDNANTKVGVQQGSIRRGSGKEGSSDLVKIAAIQEFGAPKRNIPSRPAVRQAFDMNIGKIQRFSRAIVGAILDQKLTPKIGLGLIGENHVNQVKKRYTDLDSPPNALSTQRKKRKKGTGLVNNPLIDTGQLRNSVTHVEAGV